MMRTLIVLLFLIAIKFAQGQAGQLDYSFGDSGVVVLGESEGRNVMVLDDSKILLTSSPDFQIIRLNSDGSVDNTFGNNGVTEPINGTSRGSILQPDGKIIQAGPGTVLTRHLPNGTPDSSFGINGIVYVPVVSNSSDPGLALQEDQKILLCGLHLGFYMSIARLNPDGSLDSSFNGIGCKDIDLPGSLDAGRAITVLPGGKIVGAGDYSWWGDNMHAVRVLPNGSIDSTFAENGIFSINTGGLEFCRSVAAQPDGKIILAGYSSTATGYDFTAVRIDINGHADSTFGMNGIAKINFPDYLQCFCYKVKIQPDGKIILAGSVFQGPAILVRLLENGTLDSSFGTDGIVHTESDGYFYSVDLQSDGRILATGKQSNDTIPDQLLTVRYLNDIITGPCLSNFSLEPDLQVMHKYWGVNLASGTEPITYIWSWGDGSYDTLQYPSHIYDEAGFYTICLTIYDADGCVNTFCNSFDLLKSSAINTMIEVNIVEEIPLNIGDTDKEPNNLNVYPNPTHDVIHLRLNEPAVASYLVVSLLNYTGKVVYTEKIEVKDEKTFFSITPPVGLPDGFYVAQINCENQLFTAPVLFSR